MAMLKRVTSKHGRSLSVQSNPAVQPPVQDRQNLDVHEIKLILDDFPSSAIAQVQFKNILGKLRLRHRKFAPTRQDEELEAEVLQTGYLLGFIDLNDVYWGATISANRTVQMVKRQWGDAFFFQLRDANVFLPSRLSRNSARILSRVSQAHGMDEFCPAIKQILSRPMRQPPRRKGQFQANVPAAGCQIVQIQNLKEAEDALFQAGFASSGISFEDGEPLEYDQGGAAHSRTSLVDLLASSFSPEQVFHGESCRTSPGVQGYNGSEDISVEAITSSRNKGKHAKDRSSSPTSRPTKVFDVDDEPCQVLDFPRVIAMESSRLSLSAAERAAMEPSPTTPSPSRAEVSPVQTNSKQRLDGETIHCLIRAFNPKTLLRLAEASDTAALRTTTSACMESGPPGSSCLHLFIVQ
jgi:hypothetical protein